MIFYNKYAGKVGNQILRYRLFFTFEVFNAKQKISIKLLNSLQKAREKRILTFNIWVSPYFVPSKEEMFLKMNFSKKTHF